MSVGTIFWLFVYFVMLGACYNFFVRGRAYGYQALTVRTKQLNAQGVTQVWLLYGDEGVGLNVSGSVSAWAGLNTGFLAYIHEQNLVIEFPWWNTMRQYTATPISQLQPTPSKVIFNRKSYPAVRIGDQSYVAMALNLQNAATAKQLLKMSGTPADKDLLRQFQAYLASPSLSAKSVADGVTSAIIPPSKLKLSILNVAWGTFLYILLPSLLLAILLLGWAVLTNQPTAG